MTKKEKKLRTALEELLVKLEAATPFLNSVCLMSQNHGAPYRGPTFGDEMTTARKVLDETK